MVDDTDDDLMLRALVQLTESQNQRIEGLRRAVVDLQSQLQARRDLDVLLAHEIRTPLTVVTGALRALQGAGLDEARAELVTRARAQADHLVAVADDLLAPRAAGGPLFPRAPLRDVPLRGILDQAVDAVTSRHPETTVAVDAPDVVVATATSRAVGILVNLLENAAKYGGGRIDVTARLEDGPDVVVEIADRGPGLPADVEPEQLFAPFARGANVGAASGRGVGLYLVRELARSLGGTIALRPRDGGGAVALVRLPQRRADDPVAITTAGGASR